MTCTWRAALRRLLAEPDLAGELARSAADLPATAPLQIRRELPAGTADWLTLIPAPGQEYWYWANAEAEHHRLALGHALQVASAGPRRFAALANAWAGLARHLPADDITTASLGFAFDPAAATAWPNALLSLPAILLDHRQGRCRVSFTGLASQGLANIERWHVLLAEPVASPGPRLVPNFTAPPQPLADQAWQARVGAALRDIAAGHLDKVVLSRNRRLVASAPVPSAGLLAALLRRQPGTTVFAHGRPDGQVFLGATPERLVSLRAGQASADALAGTAWDDAPTQADPLTGDKNSREQRLVGTAVQAALAALCTGVGPLGAPEILQLNGLAHLRNRVGGPVHPGVGLFDLIAGLHPTPAVGGSPGPAALDWLHRHGDSRAAWYSGGIGFIHGNGDGEIAVPLRCALVDGRHLDLQAGAGIVAGSDPARELAETEAKMGALRDALAHLGDQPAQDLCRTG